GQGLEKEDIVWVQANPIITHLSIQQTLNETATDPRDAIMKETQLFNTWQGRDASIVIDSQWT
ncbi:hypothetical protein P7K49_035753, partial [Saguinus oedipus]